ncbi:hypothetical protein ACFL2U_01570 [Patescibacteria group bacterium]
MDAESKQNLVPKYRVLYQEEDGNWEVKECDSMNEANCWMIGHTGSVLLRYAVVTDGGKLYYDTKEEAIKIGGEKNCPWSLVQPGANLCSAATEKAYSA